MVFARKTKRRIAVAMAPDEWRMEGVSGVLNNTIIVSALCLAFSVSLQTTIGKDEACLPLACALCCPLRTAWSAQFDLHASAQFDRMQCAVDDELSVQLLAADQNLRALHEAKFRIFLASSARQLNLPDDNWQILDIPNFHAIEYMENSANSSFPFTLMGIPLPDDQFVAAYTLLTDKIPQA